MSISGKNLLVTFALLFGLQSQAQELIPLAVGNSWEFSAKNSSPETRIEVQEAQEVGGKAWFKLSEFGDIFWVRNGSGGQYEAGYDEDGKLTEEGINSAVLFLPFPVKDRGAHRPWPNDPDMKSASMKYWKNREKCSVPAGTFDCVNYEWSEENVKILWVIAPGVGVLSYTYSETGEYPEFLHMKLMSYKLN